MQTQSVSNTPVEEKTVFIKMVTDAWETQNSRFNKLLDELTTDQLMLEVAPGRNTGIYLAGHLVAVSDAMLPILGFGEKLYPQLTHLFISNPDKSGFELPTVEELKKFRDEINTQLSGHMSRMKPEDWFAKHASISAEDFEKEPHRNKLNILINRTNHHSYHLGQLAFLAKP